MKHLTSAVIFALCAGPMSAQDIKGGEDHPLLGRFEGAHIVAYESAEFDEQGFLVGKEEGERDPFTLTHEGQTTRIQYHAPAGSTAVEILRGYEQRLSAQGFDIAFKCQP